MEAKVSSRPSCLTLSFGTAVSIDPTFYEQQIRCAKVCKDATQLVLRFHHVHPDLDWGPTLQKTLESCPSSISRIWVQIMGGTPSIPAQLAEVIGKKYRDSPIACLEVMLVGVDAQVEAMTVFVNQISSLSLKVGKVILGFSWFHPRADMELHRLSHAVSSVVESQSLDVGLLNLSKIHFKGKSLSNILRSVEHHPMGLEISGFAETLSFWAQLEAFRSPGMLSLSPYSGHDFPVASLLEKNCHLCSVSLDLFRCEPGQAFQPSELIKAFQDNTSIHTLSLRGCRNGYQVSFLTKLLPTLRHVKHLEWGYIDYDCVRQGQWPTADIVQAFRQNFNVQSFLLHRHRKETNVDKYSLFSDQEEAQIRHCLHRNKTIEKWAENPFEMPMECLPRVVAIAMECKNPTLALQLFHGLNVNLGPVL